MTEPEDLLDSTTNLPTDAPPVEREARIVEWIEQDDGIPEDSAPAFYSSEKFYELPEEESAKPTWSTRLGGVPRWIQSPDEAPQGWRFVGQLDSTYSFLQAPSTDAPGVFEDTERWEGRSHYCEGPNFGDGGIAYLFVREGGTTPEGWFFWQCG